MIRARSEAGRQGVNPGLVSAQSNKVGLHRLAMGDGAGLVECQRGQLATLLKVHTALDENALACGRSQAADDGYRRGDHQCTGAGNHQQHQRLVDPVHPLAGQEQRRHHRGQQGDQEHCRRIDLREAVDEALGRRAAGLGGLHRVDDPRQRRIAGRGADPVLEGAGAVDAAGEHAVALGLVDRQALAGDRRLVDRRAAVAHHAVEGDALARTQAHGGADRHLRGRQAQPATVGLEHAGRRRRQLHQAADRVARAIQRARLDALGQGEEEHHHGRLRPLADQHGAADRDRHQRVDVQVAVLQGDPALAVGRQPAGGDRQRGQRHLQPVVAVQPVHRLGEGRAHPGQRQQPGAARRRPLPVSRSGAGGGVGRHADGRQGRAGGGAAVGEAGAGQAAGEQVELQRLDAGQRAQPVADQPLLGRTVHVVDAQHAALQVVVRRQALRVHVDGLQGGLDRRRRGEPVAVDWRALQQVEGQPADSVERLQPVADQPLLGRTVHVVDAVAHHPFRRAALRRRSRTAATACRAFAHVHLPKRLGAVNTL